MAAEIEISVIIPVYNDSKRIKACIESVAEQAHDLKVDIIVVDDGSDDDTPLVLDGLKGITTISNSTNIGQSASRNRGARLAKSEYLLFIDSDVELLPSALKRAGAFIKYPRNNQKLKGIQGVFTIHSEFSNWASMFYNALQYMITSGPKVSSIVNTSCFLIEKKTFFAIGAFNENIWYMEDVEFSRRAAAAGVSFARDMIYFKHKKYLEYKWLIKQHFIGGMQLACFNTTRNINAMNSNTKEKNYFVTNILKQGFLAALICGGLYYHPLLYLLIPAAFLYVDTFKALYLSNKNPFFIISGFITLNMIPFVILSGYVFGSIFAGPSAHSDRASWLASNLRTKRK